MPRFCRLSERRARHIAVGPMKLLFQRKLPRSRKKATPLGLLGQVYSTILFQQAWGPSLCSHHRFPLCGGQRKWNSTVERRGLMDTEVTWGGTEGNLSKIGW